jgi:adenosylhomocysteinase
MNNASDLNATAKQLRVFMADIDVFVKRAQLLRDEIEAQKSLPKSQQKDPAYLDNAIAFIELRDFDLRCHGFLEKSFPNIADEWYITKVEELAGPKDVLDLFLTKKVKLNHALNRINVEIHDLNAPLDKIKKSDHAHSGFFDEPLYQEFVENVFHKAPLLDYYSDDPVLKTRKPFAGRKVLLVLHFLRDLIPFMEGLIRLGLEPGNAVLFYKIYRYPQKKAVSDWLQAKGFKVEPSEKIDNVLEKLASDAAPGNLQILLVEDGGFIVPAILKKHKSLASRVIGAVEQTTRGIWNIQEILKESGDTLSYPVLSIPMSLLKREFEPQYVGRAVVRNIQALVSGTLSGSSVALLGFGTIGQAIADSLKSENAKIVAVYDKDSTKMLRAQQMGLTWVDSAAQAVRDAKFVIGCSGNRSIDSSVIAELRHDAHLVSASSERYEIDVEELERRASRHEEFRLQNRAVGTDYILDPGKRCIHLLADGYPINFWGMNSMPDEASDLIMTLIFLAVAELATDVAFPPGIQNQAINEIAERHKVARKFLEVYKQN